MIRLLALAAAVLIGAAAGSASSSAGTQTGLRLIKLTDHNDQTGQKTVYNLSLMPTDRLYVNRHEFEIVHADLTEDSIPLEGFGNMTITRVKP